MGICQAGTSLSECSVKSKRPTLGCLTLLAIFSLLLIPVGTLCARLQSVRVQVTDRGKADGI